MQVAFLKVREKPDLYGDGNDNIPLWVSQSLHSFDKTFKIILKY